MIPTTQQDILDLFDRLLPLAYVGPLKDPGPGYELLQAYAKLFERASVAIKNFDLQAFILTATGGSYATGSVQLFRPNANAGAVTVKAGTVVSCSKSGRDFVTARDVTFTASGWGSDTAIVAPITAVAPGYEYNVAGAARLAMANAMIALTQGATTLLAESTKATNLCPNPSFELSNNNPGVQGDSWGQYNNSSGLEPGTMSLIAGRTGGLAQRITWAVNNTTTKGVRLLGGAGLGVNWLPGHTYLVAVWVRAGGTNIGQTMQVATSWNPPQPVTMVPVTNPPLTANYQRYIEQITWGASVTGNPIGGLFITIPNNSGTQGTLDFDDVEVIDLTELLGDFPGSGSLVIDKGLASEETVAYSSISLTTGAFQTAALTKSHAIGASTQLAPPTSKSKEVLPGDIDTLKALVTSPSYGDPSITVDGDVSTACVGGIPPLLDALGTDVGVSRSSGETDPQFRKRIRSLPDSITPAAIKRYIANAFSQYGASAPAFIETFQQSYQGNWDFPQMLALWHCDEPGASDNLIDALGRANLIAGGSTGVAAGLVGSARSVGLSAQGGWSGSAQAPQSRFYLPYSQMTWTVELLFNIDASVYVAGKMPYNNNSGTIFGFVTLSTNLIGFAFNGGRRKFRYYDQNGVSNFLDYDWGTIPPGWHHLTVRGSPQTYANPPSPFMDTAKVDWFVDGVLIGTIPGIAQGSTGSATFTVGGEGTGFDGFKGLIDEVVLWGSSLPDGLIALRAKAALAGKAAGQTIQSSHVFVYDDPLAAGYPGSGFSSRGVAGFFNRWLDTVDQAGAFITVVPPIACLTDFGMAYDDPEVSSSAPTPATYTTPAGGRRGTSVYDCPTSVTGDVLQGGYDGFDPARAGVYLNFFKQLQRLKAAGVAAIVELAGQ